MVYEPFEQAEPPQSNADAVNAGGLRRVDSSSTLEVYAHLCERGVDASPPYVTSYGMREVSVRDPDGFRLHFLSPAPTGSPP